MANACMLRDATNEEKRVTGPCRWRNGGAKYPMELWEALTTFKKSLAISNLGRR